MQNHTPALHFACSRVTSLFKISRVFLALLPGFLFPPFPVNAADSSEAALTSLQIGKIQIDSDNVFDLSNQTFNRFPYTWANKIHVISQPALIRKEILFKESDAYDEGLVKESERILRTRRIFRYVTISPQPPVNGKVDVVIKTSDVWTTTVQTSYGTAGGKNFYEIGFLERNFLGNGQTFGAFAEQNIDRFVKGFTYGNPHVLGTPWESFFGYGQDQKGQDWEGRIEKQYKSVLTENSSGVLLRKTENEDRLFENGEKIASFNHDRVIVRAFGSWALERDQEKAHRVGASFESRQDDFFDFQADVPSPAPQNRTVNAVLATYQYQQNRYEKIRGVRTFDRDEDIHQGWDFRLGMGPSLESIGSTRDGVVGRTEVGKSWRLLDNHLFSSYLKFNGRHEQGRLVDSEIRTNGQYTILNWWKENVVSLRGEGTFGINLPVDKQLLLGGENGLRGYSVRQFSGNRKVILTLENRRVLLYDWLNLVNLGWAVFADTGGVWKEHQKMSHKNFRSDVGAGFRFSPSRSFDPSLIRIDVATALNENNRRSRWSISIGGELKFGDIDKRKFDE